MDRWAASTAAQHLVSSMDRVFDRIGAGRATISWDVRGTRADGPAWRLTRTNRFASLYDAPYDSVNELANQIFTIVDNPYSAVKLTSIALTATVQPDYGLYTVDGVQALQNDAWVELTDGVWSPRGSR